MPSRYHRGMRRGIAAVMLSLWFGCGDQRLLPETFDAAPSDVLGDGRELGVINGECTGQPGAPRVLIYTYESIWRHFSNYYAFVALSNMCNTRGFNIKTTNDPRALNATRLADIDVIAFSLTSGPGMDPFVQKDVEAWVRAGGGIVGLHSASATEPDWTFYNDNLGARFAGHAPGLQEAVVQVLPGHPITDGLASFTHTDEWYLFQPRPEDVPGMQMLLALDETTLPPEYPEEQKVGYHPIGWAHDNFGGRVFYTALGHNEDSFTNPVILELIGRSIEWAAHRR